MPHRKFASWVEPIARRDREARSELLECARSLPADAWLGLSPLDGWTRKDLLAHLAGDTGKWFAHILRSVLDGEPLDPRRVGPGANIDAINQRDVDERHSRSVEELISEIEADGQEHERLLLSLTDDQANFRLILYSVSLAEFFRDRPAGGRGPHDREHAAQLGSTLEPKS